MESIEYISEAKCKPNQGHALTEHDHTGNESNTIDHKHCNE